MCLFVCCHVFCHHTQQGNIIEQNIGGGVAYNAITHMKVKNKRSGTWSHCSWSIRVFRHNETIVATFLRKAHRFSCIGAYLFLSHDKSRNVSVREKAWCFAIHPIAGSPSRPIRLQDIAMWCKSPMLFGLLHRTWLVRALFLLFLTRILYSAQVFPQYIKSAPGCRNPSHRQSGVGSARRALAVLRLHVTLYS